MKKLFFFFLFIPNIILAQYYDIGVSGGTAYYIGDLNNIPFNPSFLSYSWGAHYRINFSNHYSTKSSLGYSKIMAEDAKSKNSFNKDRNLSFESNILEISQTIEFNFLPFEMGNPDKKFTPYIFGGIALFKFSPKAKYIDGTLYDLQFLGTEGQNSVGYPEKKKYDLTEIAIPFGIGLKINLSRAISFSFEWGTRKTNTDYIDDVSGAYPDVSQLLQSNGAETAYFADRSLSNSIKTGQQKGDSKPSDWYSLTTATLYFSFGKKAKYSCFSHKNH